MEKPDMNKFLSNVREKAASVWQKIRKIKIKGADAIVTVGVIVLSGLIIVPSIATCVINYKKAAHEQHIYNMLSILSDELTNESETGGSYWHDLISDGNYQKLLSSLTEKTGEGKKYPASMFYIRTGEDKIYVMSREYKDMPEKELRINPIPEKEFTVREKPELGERIVYLSVTGPDIYYVNDVLDASNPRKMKFTGLEVDKIIQNLRVNAVYQGGRREELPRSRYTILARALDMSKTGQTHLTVKSNSTSVWDNSSYAPFVIDVVKAEDAALLIVDAGINGKYDLASWDWASYVEEAAEEKDGKEFDASIISYNGKFYYFPDGLYIDNSDKNISPLINAYNIDNHDETAYYLEFDLNSIILNSSDEEKIHNGSLKADNEVIYIYQEQPSKELPAGWIRVYCELKKY